MDVVVLSLFDGLSGGRLALESVPTLNVLRYFSSEIHKYSIQISDKNYPEDSSYRLGSVIELDGISLRKRIQREFGDVKILLIGGSPCQGFSMAGKRKGSSTVDGVDVVSLEQYKQLKQEGFHFHGESYLFWEYIRIKEELQPDYFLLENVRITRGWLPMFNKAMGVEPTIINSSLFSAQHRLRFYWHNFGEIPAPTDKGITLDEILIPTEEYSSGDECDHGVRIIGVKPSVSKNIIQQLGEITEGKNGFHQLRSSSGFQDNKIGITKTPTLRAGNSSTYVLEKNKDGDIYRRMTPEEWERLQTIPEGYTSGVSNSQRYKMIGNGWTIDVVSYLLSFIVKS